MNRPLIVALASVVALSMASSLCDAQRVSGHKPSATVPAPVALDTHGQFEEKLSRVGDDVFISGQPTEAGFRALRDQGVTMVVNLRSPPEVARLPFDEPALVKRLGMNYVYLPMRGNAEFPYSPERLKEFADAMSNATGKVLLHCTVAWRASHMWAAYLIQYRGVPVETALAQARAINLMDDMRMDGDQQPVEQLLNRSIPQVGRGKQ